MLASRFVLGRIIGVIWLIAFIAVRIWDPAPVEILRLKVFDLFQVFKPRVVTARPTVIVDIDEASLEAYGQWPWPRSRVAELITRITQMGAAGIAIDIIFPEADRLSPDLLAKNLTNLSASARQELAALQSNDLQFAEAMRRSRVVVGQSGLADKKTYPKEIKYPQTPLATLGGDPTKFLFQFPGLLRNIPELEAAAAGRGVFTIRPEKDGIVRRVPAILLAQGMIVPSLAVELLRVATGASTLLIKRDDAGVKSLIVARVEIPTDRNGQIWVYFSLPDRERYISARDILEGKVSPERFKGKLVLVGTSAVGLFDIKSTPNNPAMPGVEVHAQLIETVLTKSQLSRPHYAIGAEICLTILVGLTFIILVPRLGAIPVLILGGILSIILVSGAWYFFLFKNSLIDVVFPLISSMAVFGILVFVNYSREEIQRSRIRSAFGQYLSPDLVEQLVQDPDKLVLGGETRDLTILFADVRRFTAISELYRDDPKGLTLLMNRFLTPLSNAIIDCKGTIDKYMGDAIMAFWNAPLDDERHAKNACEAALMMIQRMEALNIILEEEAKKNNQQFLPLEVGFGINTGSCVVGNMGSDLRFDYSVLGDSVNIASRLEGQTKTYKVRILIGAATAVLVKDDFAILELDRIRVKGKKEPETIYTVLGRKALAEQPEFRKLSDNLSTLLALYRKEDWDGALGKIESCRKTNSGFNLSNLFDLFEDRIQTFKHTPPETGWGGVYTMDEK